MIEIPDEPEKTLATSDGGKIEFYNHLMIKYIPDKERAYQEYSIQKYLSDHEIAPKVHGFEKSGDYYRFQMKRVKGNLLYDTRLTQKLFDAIKRKVEKMHSLGVWHGDLHSGNIMIERTGKGFRVYIIDFGRSAMLNNINMKTFEELKTTKNPTNALINILYNSGEKYFKHSHTGTFKTVYNNYVINKILEYNPDSHRGIFSSIRLNHLNLKHLEDTLVLKELKNIMTPKQKLNEIKKLNETLSEENVVRNNAPGVPQKPKRLPLGSINPNIKRELFKRINNGNKP